MTRRYRAGLAALSIIVACTTPADVGNPEPITMSIVSGDGQHGPPGVELPDPLIARIENSRGRPVIGQIVNFRVVLGGGSVFAGATISNRDGLVSERWTLGAAGAQRVEVRAVDPETGNPLTFAVFRATLDTIPPTGDTIPPIASNVNVFPNPAHPTDSIIISALVSDSFTGHSNIVGGDVQVDSGTPLFMSPSDGAFDQQNELVNRTFNGLAVGGHTACVRGRDAAGNIGAFTCTSFTITNDSGGGDTLGPETVNVTADTLPGDSTVIRAEVRDTFTGGSNIAGAEMRVDSGGFVMMFPTDGAFDQQNEAVNRLVVGLAAGGHSVCVRGRDTAGNTGNETCLAFSVAAIRELPRRARRQR